MQGPQLSESEESFLDELFDRTVRACGTGEALDLDALLADRAHLREPALRAIELAREVAVGTEPRFPGRRVPSVEGFTLLEEVGRGGMGVVYRARQEELGRIVALKVLPPSLLASARIRERFQAEARALARVRHPHVVTIHAILFDEDLCAYAMEWVDGTTLARTIDAHGPGTSVRAIAELGAAIARALSAVHDAGLVHRDVKPSNILLRRDGTPLLSDFSLARDPDHSHHTATGEFLGTAAYAPPEQLRGTQDEVGPRSDIYSLGATLYAALSGKAPFGSTSTAEMLRRIEHGRCAPLRKLAPGVPRELATVVAKAMDPDPARRYASAAELADDLERFLRFEPVRAKAAGPLLRFERFARRRPAVLTSIALGLLLAVGAPTTLYFLERAARLREEQLGREIEGHRQAAEAASAKAMHELEIQRGLTQLMRDVLRRGDATQADGRADMTIREALDGASADFLGGKRKWPPEVEYSLRMCLAEIHLSIGRVETAATHLEAAGELRQGTYGDESEQAGDVAYQLGRAFRDLGQLAEGERWLLEAVRIRRELLDRERASGGEGRLASNYLAQALNSLGIVLRRLEKYAQAEAACTEALELYRRTLGEENENVGQVLGTIGRLQLAQRRVAEAEASTRAGVHALVRFREINHAGRPHIDVPNLEFQLGTILCELGRHDEGERTMRTALEQGRALVGPEHRLTFAMALDLGRYLLRAGRLAEAEPLLREAAAAGNALGSLELPRTLDAETLLAELLLEGNRAAEAEALLLSGLERAREACIARGWLRRLGSARSALGRFAEAEIDLHQAWSAVQDVPEQQDERRATAAALATLYERWSEREPDPGRASAAAEWAVVRDGSSDDEGSSAHR